MHVSRDDNPALREYFDELLTLDDVDRLLTRTYSAEPRRLDSVRMGRDGAVIPPERYLTIRDDGLAELDLDRVLTLHRDGASIILNSVQAAIDPVAGLCQALAQFAGLRVHANVYVTPREAQGFPLHFDAHDVFLLQVAGEKHWRVSPSPVPLARWEARDASQLERQGPETEVCLRSGELLYIPRGMLHEGVTSGNISVHLTIGMSPLTWAELLHELVVELEAEDVDFRRSVSIGDGELGAGLARVTARLGNGARARRVAERKIAELRGRDRGHPRGLFSQIHESERIELDTLVELRRDAEPELVRDRAELRLRFAETVLTLPAFAKPQLAALCAGQPICARDLPDGIDDEGKLVLVRRMVREGLLACARDGR